MKHTKAWKIFDPGKTLVSGGEINIAVALYERHVKFKT